MPEDDKRRLVCNRHTDPLDQRTIHSKASYFQLPLGRICIIPRLSVFVNRGKQENNEIIRQSDRSCIPVGPLLCSGSPVRPAALHDAENGFGRRKAKGWQQRRKSPFPGCGAMGRGLRLTGMCALITRRELLRWRGQLLPQRELLQQSLPLLQPLLQRRHPAAAAEHPSRR